MSGPGKGKGRKKAREGGCAINGGAATGRTVRFELPLRMGFREIREIRLS